MIMTEKKPIDDIKASLKESQKSLNMLCGNCATLTQSGGEEQVKKMPQLPSGAHAHNFGKSHPVTFSS